MRKKTIILMNLIYLSVLLFKPFVSGATTKTEKLSLKGKVYFDFYYIPVTATNINNSLKNGDFANIIDPARKDESANRYGFQIRRIYITADKKFNKKFSSRIRLEMANSPYKLNSDKSLIPFIKDAYLRYKYLNNHSITFGIASPPTLILYEKRLWAYRSVEKVPEDLYKIRSSRDFGVSLKGSFGELKYNFMFGNGKGSETEDQTYKETKTLYLGLSYFLNKNLFIEFYNDVDIVPVSSEERYTFHLLLGILYPEFRTGIQYVYQDLGMPKYINIISIPFVYNVSDKISILIRLDNRKVYTPAQAQTTGIVSDNFIILGMDYKISPGISFIPNIEIATYSFEKNNPTGSRTDIVAKFTVYYKF